MAFDVDEALRDLKRDRSDEAIAEVARHVDQLADLLSDLRGHIILLKHENRALNDALRPFVRDELDLEGETIPVKLWVEPQALRDAARLCGP